MATKTLGTRTFNMTNLTHRPRISKVAAGRHLALAVVALSIFTAAVGSPASAQEPPSPRVEIAASIELEDCLRQYDLVQMLVEFAPGAANQSHRVNGRAIFTLLSGELTRIEEDGETTVFSAGQTFSEADSDHFDVEINNGPVPAQLLATFLLQPEAQPLTIDPNAMRPSIGPSVIAMARTTVGPIAAQFTLAHGIIVTDPGGVAPPHTHDGWQMVTILAGEPVVLLDGVVHMGATFVERPGVVHEGYNPGPDQARFMFARLNPLGSPPARPLVR